jgi:hypothetical protein
MAAQIAVARPSISHHFPFCKPPDHVAMNYLTCHFFTVFASYFEFAAFSSLAIPCADRRKTLETAAERSSIFDVSAFLLGAGLSADISYS